MNPAAKPRYRPGAGRSRHYSRFGATRPAGAWPAPQPAYSGRARNRQVRNPSAPPVVDSLGALHRDALLDTKDSRDRRPLIFLAVLISHVAIVLLLIRTARQAISSPRSAEESLVVLLLPDKALP